MSDSVASSPMMEGQAEVVFVTGRWGPSIGGPFQTHRAYQTALERAGRQVAMAAMPAPGTYEGTSFFRRMVSGIRDTTMLARSVLRHDVATYVFLGVWHVGFMLCLPLVAIMRPSRPIVLIPTQSLSPVDWAKRRRLKRLLLPFVRLLVSRLDLVIFASSGEQREATPHIPSERATVVHHPMVPPLVEPLASIEAKLDSPLSIAILGRLHPQKDHELALRALSELPDAVMHVVGAGEPEYALHLKKYAEKVGVQTRVVWHGWQDREAALGLVRDSTVTIVTSVAENYCHAAVESMYVGTPVIMVDRIASSADFAAVGAVWTSRPAPKQLAGVVREVTGRQMLYGRLAAAGREFALRRAGSGALDQIVDAIQEVERRQ